MLLFAMGSVRFPVAFRALLEKTADRGGYVLCCLCFLTAQADKDCSTCGQTGTVGGMAACCRCDTHYHKVGTTIPPRKTNETKKKRYRPRRVYLHSHGAKIQNTRCPPATLLRLFCRRKGFRSPIRERLHRVSSILFRVHISIPCSCSNIALLLLSSAKRSGFDIYLIIFRGGGLPELFFFFFVQNISRHASTHQ